MLSVLDRFKLNKRNTVAPPGFNRWWVPLASISIHLCIGSIYAWSIFNVPLTRAVGVAASSSADWDFGSVVWVFSVAIVFAGLSAAVAGRWLEAVGPRMVGVAAACLWGGGLVLGGLGVVSHQLWLLYLGYGAVGGAGLGLGYVSPVGTLLRWFPDRRGMATGMAIMGFGGGAMVAAPLQSWLMGLYYQAPEYLGSVRSVALMTEDSGRRLAQVGGALREVVIVGPGDVASMIQPGPQGVYLVGTGSSGVAETFFTLGIAYFVVMLAAAFAYRIPAPGWSPSGGAARVELRSTGEDCSRGDVDLDRAMKTPQFYLLWIVLCLNVTAGIGVLGVASTMMSEVFGTTLPHVVDGAFAATYVVMISVFNMAGRFVWASFSDFIGRKATFHVFCGAGAVLFLSVPYAAQQVSASPGIVWLVLFYASTMVIFTMFGGGFATIPSYVADIFGTKFAAGIHGRLLTAWSVAGVLGPLAITSLRASATRSAIEALAAKASPLAFRAKFGAGVEDLDQLVATKAVTIAKLMEIVPPGTVDPSSGLYSTTMVAMAGLLMVALVANHYIRPINRKHHMRQTPL